MKMLEKMKKKKKKSHRMAEISVLFSFSSNFPLSRAPAGRWLLLDVISTTNNFSWNERAVEEENL